jgi:hypothetical protein
VQNQPASAAQFNDAFSAFGLPYLINKLEQIPHHM